MATVVVYAGAILVTFLFVLMLAQPEGNASYDRVSWEALLSAVTGVVIVGVLSMTIGGDVHRRPSRPAAADRSADADRPRPHGILDARSTSPDWARELFGRHLIAVEVAGTLLLVALVGAAVIVDSRQDAAMNGRPQPARRNRHAITKSHCLNNYLIVGAMLFGIGLIGFLSRRNMIVMFLSAEIMLQGVSLSLVAWGRFHNDFGGQMLVMFIIAVAACEAAIALALVVDAVPAPRQARHRRLAGPARGQPAAVRRRNRCRRSRPTSPPHWPHLAPAGVEPSTIAEKENYRPNV